ncbi:MAG: hypothetical protein HFE84_01645 [Lachnospiraceae bacterium]|nr:hypothetical protein [Lachnospiraceae bacterium]
MRKKAVSILVGILLCTLLSGISITVCAAEPTDTSSSLEEESWDLGYDNGADMVYPFLPSTFNVPWDKQTDEENLQYLIDSGDAPGAEGLKWWVNSGFDDVTKLTYLNTIKNTGRDASLWVIGSALSLEEKSTYFRSHDLRGQGSDVLLWWFDNIGSKLTTEQTRKTDAHNYEWYTRSVLNTLEGVEVVTIGESRYYIAKADLDKNIAAGNITTKTKTVWWEGAPENAWTVYLYSAASVESLGCKLWNLAE